MAIYQSALGQIGPRSSQNDLDEFAPKDSRIDSQFLTSNDGEIGRNFLNLKNTTGGEQSMMLRSSGGLISSMNSQSKFNRSSMSLESKARVKLNQMQLVRSQDSPAAKDYRTQLKYFQRASLYHVNNGQPEAHQKTYKQLMAPILTAANDTTYNERNSSTSPDERAGLGGLGTGSYKKIGDAYPKLMNELNDANAKIPAYVRF